MTLASGTEAKVSIRGLRKDFVVRGRTIEALAPADLDVRAGECIAIVGPSGCGKTTPAALADAHKRGAVN